MAPAERRGWPASTSAYQPPVAQASLELALDAFELADQIGFDWVTVAEHHYAPICLTPNPQIMAAALSQRVKRAKIAVLGADIPILNPIRVAEEFAMLDNLTGGRVIAGLLRGIPTEYLTYGTNPDESRERFEEGLQLIVRAWTEPQPFGWLGRFYEYRTVSIWPRPLQQPHPPIFMSGSSRDAAAFAARARVAVGFAATTIAQACESLRHYCDQAAASGWGPTREQVLYRIPVHIARTDTEARETLDPEAFIVGQPVTSAQQALSQSNYRASSASGTGRLPPTGQSDVDTRVERGQLLLGSPDTVLKQIARIKRDLDPGILDLHFPDLNRDSIMHAVELFGTRVLPRMQQL
jgi:alkanesulfonate monooxygenase SsuD/methylene tetrahydromethanopterin reductase-like flavin-dependent oxidoreductase (luciferase family)